MRLRENKERESFVFVCMCIYVCVCVCMCKTTYIYTYIHTGTKKEATSDGNDLSKNQRRVHPEPSAGTPHVCALRGETVGVAGSRHVHTAG